MVKLGQHSLLRCGDGISLYYYYGMLSGNVHFTLLVNPLKKSSKRPLLIQFIKILTKKFLSTSIKNKLYTLFTKKTMIYSNINNGLSKILSNSITAFPFEFHKYKSSYKIIHIFNHHLRLLSTHTLYCVAHIIIIPGGLPLFLSPTQLSRQRRPVSHGSLSATGIPNTYNFDAFVRKNDGILKHSVFFKTSSKLGDK